MRRICLCLALTALLATVTPVHATEQAQQSDGPAAESPPANTPATDVPATDSPTTDSPAIDSPTSDGPTVDSPTAIINADGGLLQILQDHQWSLKSATDDQSQAIAKLFPADADPYQFTFSAANLNFQGGCNTFGGGYQINAQGQLQAGQIRSTMMACEPALMQADTALGTLLAQPLQITIMWGAPPQLQLRTAAAETLILEGRVTPEAVYGPSTLIFLEVDARQLPCRNPRNTQTTCLQVREITFDEQGLRSAISGPWQPFYDEIEGYTHIPGQRNVLRVKRFDRDAASGVAAPAVFVLDLIVETEIVPQDVPQAAPKE